MLKKKYRDDSSTGTTSPPSASGFFANTLQRTKQNLSKFSNAFHHPSKSEKEISKMLSSGSAHNIGENASISSNKTNSSSNNSFNSGNNTSSSYSTSNLPDIMANKPQLKLNESFNVREFLITQSLHLS